MIKRALVSVSDKTGVVDFCKDLSALGYEIISTGGTAKTLTDNGVKVIGISDITGFPECLDGRVKTLHPNVHAGLLAIRSNPEHMQQLENLKINTIDIVCVNLYPFKKTIEKPDVEFQEAVENIDIGGPTMLRSAAKNFQDVAVLVDPKDYQKVISELKADGVSLDTKKYLMYKVFAHTAAYDSLISNYLASKLNLAFPESLTLSYEKAQEMRYGENPHQMASFYKEQFSRSGSITKAVQLHGKELSYNNINDSNGALDLLREFSEPTVIAVKHANPCGVGSGKSIYEAFIRAYEADNISIYGGIIAVNDIVDELTATEINKIFIEIIIAKGYTDKALEILKQKKNIRILLLPDIGTKLEKNACDMKKVYGGLLIQGMDNMLYNDIDIKVVTKRAPTEEEMRALIFNWKVVKHTKSNAIVIGKEGRTTGIGAGQTNRIWACEQAISHAGAEAKGSVLASDAYFPFPDCVEAAAKAGITAIMQPGGSVKDDLSIEECDKNDLAMVFVGSRHFKH
jgi:phosphoribosylaminoimidazolecarboxamide formyltransferase/IMP cyclohydrolase